MTGRLEFKIGMVFRCLRFVFRIKLANMSFCLGLAYLLSKKSFALSIVPNFFLLLYDLR